MTASDLDSMVAQMNRYRRLSIYTASVIACLSSMACAKSSKGVEDAAVQTEDAIKKTALSLCGRFEDRSPSLAMIPADLQGSVRQEDLEYLQKGPTTDAGAPDAGAPDAGGAAVPATCEVTGLDMQPTTATVKLKKKRSGVTSDYAVNFIRVQDTWRADLHLPEAAKIRAAISKLRTEVTSLVKRYEWDAAKEKLTEALKLQPDDEEIKEALATVDKRIASRVAGRWVKQATTDAMTDKENITLTLPSSTDFSTDYSTYRPVIIVRCIKGSPDVFVAVESVVGGSYFGATAQYRFDKEAAQSVTLNHSEDLHGLFFPEPLKWMDRLTQHSAGKFILEIPLYGKVAQPATFELQGADVAIPAAKAACK